MLQISRRQMILTSGASLLCTGLASTSWASNGWASTSLKAAANTQPIEAQPPPNNATFIQLSPLKLIRAARSQIGVTTRYNGAYTSLSYPGGDVDRVTGVCVDVVIRAYRDAFDIDLQRLVHEDMKANFDAYPNLWRLTRPDRNIDHRRVPNLETFFTRQGSEKPANREQPNSWQPGDLISMRLQGNLPHIAIISDRKAPSGQWLVIHNIGRGAREEDIINRYNKQRRFQYFPAI